jgi:hypothetical protein
MATIGLAKIRITTKISEAKMAEYFIESSTLSFTLE